MKETKKQTIVVTEYTTDFGTKFTDKDLCKECEIQEYKRVYSSLYDIANSEQKILLIAMMEELSEHLSSAYCEQGINNDGIANMVEFYNHTLNYGTYTIGNDRAVIAGDNAH